MKDKNEIAKQFNFFLNVGQNLANKIDIKGKPDLKSYINKKKVETVFTFTPIEEEQTKTIINKSQRKVLDMTFLNFT